MAAIAVLAGLAVLAVAVVRDFQRRGRPDPAFPSLVEDPDPSLHGTVAFISEAKNPAAKARQACARVASASGAAARDVYCWEIDESALATAVWQDDGRLLVTGFEDPVGDPPMRPAWGKLVDVTTGAVEDVPDDVVGEGSTPADGPVRDPEGNTVGMTSSDGNAELTMSGPAGERTLLEVSGANPDWSLQSGPVLSADSDWVMTWDGRLLITTTGEDPITRVLAQEASGSAYPWESTPNFSIRPDDLVLE